MAGASDGKGAYRREGGDSTRIGDMTTLRSGENKWVESEQGRRTAARVKVGRVTTGWTGGRAVQNGGR